ncbi:ankyrin [Paraphaeosphaeria sporulosa]|uniref:Ankyrin n=1 Tax=Paraphaeosphaeria sporulosa TaxID=1460663 RepID=A0A177D037_9PLEO|nr:ankyrin [Paraphaeosphaeria sporulosa]OAG12718.1 ankyrin [Paraphaeosphaeria sporulosa]
MQLFSLAAATPQPGRLRYYHLHDAACFSISCPIRTCIVRRSFLSMDPLSVAASIISVLQLSGKVLGYLNDVKDASEDRAKCAVEASNVYSLLLNLRFRLEEGSADAPWYTAVRALGVENGPLDQFKQALETLQIQMTGGGRIQQAGRALVWKFKKEEIAGILVRIERLKALVGIALQMDHFKLSKAIKYDTNVLQTHVPAIHSRVDEIQQDQVNAKHSKMVGWISPTNYPAQQSDIIRRRQKGTGQWFLNAPEFTTWLGEPKGTLFCPGIPGAGKTMVAAIAIEHLLNSTQSSSVGVAYVYCNYKAQEGQDASSMLAAIVKQLVQGRPSMVEPVARLYEQHVDQGTKPSIEEIFSALREVVPKYSTVYVVIDGLDECRDSDGTRSQLLARLKDLQVGQDVRIMGTARFIPEIEAEFQTAMKLEIQASDEDVRRYIAGQTHRLPRCIQRDPALQITIQDKLVEAVDGMFLLARLHTDSLLDKRTVKEVKLTLDRLSKGSAALNDAYDDAIQRIDGQLDGDRERAKKVLLWITYARRPLTTTELCCALAVELDEAELDPENMPDIEDLLSVCAGLIVVDQESALVRLVHYTTQEYFERVRDRWNPNAPLQIASTCLTYLSFDLFKTGSCSSDKDFEKRLQESKFLDYAAKHWGEHVAKVESDTCKLACSFLFNNCLVSSATQVLLVPTYTYSGHSQEYPKASTGAHLAARFGLSCILEALLLPEGQEREADLTKKDSRGHTLLYLAAANGHCLTAGWLINNGANVNAQGGGYGNALQAASYGGHEAIVKLLLDKGAEYGNALQAASYGGHTELLDTLITNGATLKVQDYYGRTLLWWAAAGGKIATVKSLIMNHNIDPRIADNLGRKPSWIAAKKGHGAVSKLLQEHDGETSTEPTVLSNENHHQSALECNVCTSQIPTTVFHYHCNLCAGGDWDVCEDCRKCGATCVAPAHTLRKREMLDGVWSEITRDHDS